MDYDQWKPLGRGDPLKHDPTYDYVPPVLDRVQYWVDPAMRKPDPHIPGETQKTEILLLGVTSKKPANTPIQADSRRDNFDQFIKYVDGPKFTQNPNRRVASPSFFPNPSSFFPSFFPPSKIKYMENTPFSKGADHDVPSTILMPPPLESGLNNPSVIQGQTVTESTIFTSPSSTTLGSSTPSVTLQASNLVYHSSSSLNTEITGVNKESTLSSAISFEPSVTTKRTIPDFRDELVYNTHLTPPESFMRIQFAPHNFTNKPLLGSDTNQHISYVTPPPLIKTDDNSVMFKGKVTDDDISNTYVKIGKSEAEVQSTFIGSNLNTLVQHPIPMRPNIVIFPHSGNHNEKFELKLPPLTMQKLQEMQEMHPPPETQTPMFQQTTDTILKLLEKEKISSTETKSNIIVSTPPEIIQSSFLANNFVTTPSITAATTAATTSTERAVESNSTPFVNMSTTPGATTTTTSTARSPTTISMLKQFKLPVKTMKSPLYLIIQGHSKVKTYGPSKQMHGILIQDTNEIIDNDDKYKKKAEAKSLQDYNLGVIDEMNLRQGRSRNLGNIQTLKHVVQTGLGAIDLSGLNDDINRSDKNFRETELHVGYKVVDNKDMTEKYYKGIVEEARKLVV